MPRKIFRASLPVSAAVVLLTVAGCGYHAPALPEHRPSAASLISDMKTSFAIAQSVRITGHIRSHGQTTTFDLRLFRSGTMKGTLKEGVLRLGVLRAGGRLYVLLTKASFNFYRRSHEVPATACAVACGKYILLPSGSFKGMSLKGLGRLIATQAPKAGKRARKTGKNRKTGKSAPVLHVRSTKFDGQRAWELIAGKFKIFIAKQSGYLLEMSKSPFGAFRFSEWNAVPPIKAPRPNQVFGSG